jgi:hypothetical protein
MGMDVYGMEPSAPDGIYFGRNTAGWGPLADFIIETQPDIAGKLINWDESSPVCTVIRGAGGWYYNSGDGLNAESSAKLADALDKMLVNGEVTAYINMREMRIKQLPNEMTCHVCQGTGVIIEDMTRQRGMREHELAAEKGFGPNYGGTRCGCCNGRGWLRNPDKEYYLCVDDIRQFSEFLRASGGFQIW